MEGVLPANLQPGNVLRERYEIVGLIGASGMGTVYLADDNRLAGRQCAIKETQLMPTLSKQVVEAARKQFFQEASTLARLDHPGLPKVSDFFSIEERDYLVMDYVPGQDLLEIINNVRRESRFLDQATVLDWIDQLCDTLAYLHSRQPPVLHRDIKPANVKLTPDNRLKLVDFGLVKPLDPDDPNTLTGLQGAGSLPYAPLEQYVDHLGHTDARSDIYALGATFYHLLSGVQPVSAQERFLMPESLLALREINVEVSPGVADAITMAMSLHPKDRPPSVVQWRQMFRSSISTAPMESRQTDGDDWRLILREDWWLVGLAAGLLAASLWMTFGG
jgi:serine/threonine-protein kinase